MKTTKKQISVITDLKKTLNVNILIPELKQESNKVIDDLRYKLSDLIQDKYKCVSYYDHTIID